MHLIRPLAPRESAQGDSMSTHLTRFVPAQSRLSGLRLPAAAAALSFVFDSAARATLFAQYLPGSYTQGTVYLDTSGDINSEDMTFNNPTVVGDPTTGADPGLTDLDFGFAEIVTPFDPPVDADQIVTIGLGGEITLKFPQPINVASPGPSIGIFNSIGLVDSASSGTATNPATTFSNQSAVVSVSQDDKSWAKLGLRTFDIPQNYYANATDPYQFPAPDPGIVADFGKPFTGSLNSFDGENFSQVLSTLDGSAGGSWLDLSGSGLTEINYIQFSEPADQVPVTSFIALESVSVANAAVPEPATTVGLLACFGLLLRRSRKALTAILLFAGLFAAPRAARATPITAVQFLDGNVLNIQAAYGSGADTAYLVTNLNSAGQDDAWQFNWNPATPTNGWQMIEDIAGNSILSTSGTPGSTTVVNPAGDPNMTVTAEFFPSFAEHLVTNFQYGSTIGLFNDWNFDTGNYNAANLSAANPQGMTWTSSGVGIDQVTLTNNEFIGWVDVAKKPPAPVLPETAVPEPTAAIGFLGFVATRLRRRKVATSLR
jgi:hypothetical protein